MDLYIASHQLKFIATSNKIHFKLLASKHYLQPLCPIKRSWLINIDIIKQPIILSFNPDFTGTSTDDQLMPYNWTIHNQKNKVLLNIEFLNDGQLKRAFAEIDLSQNSININLQPHNDLSEIEIDPLFHPLGSLMMVYWANTTNGFLIHASGILDNNTGHLFSAISGTGKSTMAALWKKKGAIILNDDRLWVEKIEEQWYMFNTPMIWYDQQPQKAPIRSIFLLGQAPENKLIEIKGAIATMRVLSNCIQHFYNKEMTQKHVDSILQFGSETRIAQCDFKPDTDIVDQIRDFK